MNKIDVYEAIVNLNTVLVLLGTGVLIWVIRQIMPDKIEQTKVWRVVLRVLPVFIGGSLALIPGIRPLDNLTQSAIVGAVAGSLSANTYEFVRELVGKRIKGLMGSPQTRKGTSIPPAAPE